MRGATATRLQVYWSSVSRRKVSKGSACEAPSSPQCFRRKADESIYICEWTMSRTGSDVTFDLFFNQSSTYSSNEKKFGGFKETSAQINEEVLIKHRPIDIWVVVHEGKSSCMSAKRSVELRQTVKYEAPQNISISWAKNNLSLSWRAIEKHPALAEIRFQRVEHPTELWENRTINTTMDSSVYQLTVVNLLKDTAYRVQIRHRSNLARNPLWSDWTPVVIVPAELEQKPEVTMTTRLTNGTRKVILTWKPMPHAAAVTEVKYLLMDTQSLHGCPCMRRTSEINSNKHTTYVSYSAVNITVMAKNAAGFSPPEIIQVSAKPDVDLKACDKLVLDDKTLKKKKTCHELYKLQDGDSRPENVITLTARMKKKEREEIRKTIQDYVRYLYFEHICDDRKPRTIKMCLFYQKEGVPLSEPQHFTPFETQTSVSLSWKWIPSVAQQSFLTHYSLCIVKISSQDEPTECHNVSASLTKYHLENLTPGAKYNISLAGVSRIGEGPRATVTINTLPEKPASVLWSLSLLILFFLISTVCTCILKRIKDKIFPPVPTPVIPDFTPYQPETQEMLEGKEEVHELTLCQLRPEGKCVIEDAEETIIFRREWDDDIDEDLENERGDSRMSGGTSDECLGPGSTDQALRSCREGEMTDLDNEISMLIYRNGLVFDVKVDSP
ncbi:hypothetical protein D5F01_LYC06988 [Larimichthys crocea]|uniref:Fibronectin type-III domain-containing protein n=1 Tax=Larimichthys crocea TaxID=215358 RepID=A0A6G0IRS6_LARCR|nr:hypothetical protein D5F01_LYC06988 [Larimichthys crocea]